MHSVPFKKLIVYSLTLLLPFLGWSQEKNRSMKMPWSYQQTEKATQIPIVQELMLDSINQRLNQLAGLQPALSMLKQHDSNEHQANRMAQLKANLQKLQLASLQQPFSLSNLSALYSLKDKLPGFSKTPFRLTVTEASNTTLYDNQTLSSDKFISQTRLDFTTNLWGLPFTYKLVNNYPAYLNEQFRPQFKVSFDQEHLLKDIKNKLTSQFDLEKLLLKDVDFKKLFTQYGQQQLTGLKQKALSAAGINSEILNSLNRLSVEEFLYLTKDQLRQRVLGNNLLDSLSQLKNSYALLLAAAETIGAKDSLQAQLKGVEENLIKAQAFADQVMVAKDQFETKGLNYNQLVRYQQTVNAGVGNITNSSSFAQDASQKLLNLNGITRLFLHIKELNIGQFSSNWSDRSMSNVLTSGLGGSYVNKNKFLGLTIANTQPLSWLKDHSFTGSLSEPAMRMQAFRLGTGELKSAHNHFTLVNATTKNNTSAVPSLPALTRNIAVGSFSKNLSLGKWGKVAAEVAKSNTQYQGSTNAAQELESKVALSHFGADFLQTLSVGLHYENQFAKAGLEPQAFIQYAGLGYSNPASAMQARGNLYYGVQARKDLFGKKLHLQTRFSKRDTRVSVLDDRKMHQAQSSMNARYRISKKWRVSANWTYVGLSKDEADSKNTLFSSNRLGADVFYSGKLLGRPFYQYVGSGYQQLTTPGLYTGMNGKTLWINTSSNMAFEKGTLTTTLQFYNNMAHAQNDLLTADAGWNYVLFKKFQLSTAVNYLNQQHVARQAGIRQTLAVLMLKKVSVNAFGDIRHDLIENTNPFLYPKTRGEIQIIYQLN